jgi:4-hydroxybenzoate polyprenyltransferase
MTHPGDLFYWMASLLLGLVVILVIWSAFNADHGEPVIPMIPLLFAGSIWLLARHFRS